MATRQNLQILNLCKDFTQGAKPYIYIYIYSYTAHRWHTPLKIRLETVYIYMCNLHIYAAHPPAHTLDFTGPFSFRNHRLQLNRWSGPPFVNAWFAGRRKPDCS